MKFLISALAVAWLISACASATPASDDSVTGGHRDQRTGLCNDATPPPCNPPKD